ncbi:MAG: SGNH/GDSL hydrolase family protein [Desulfovibrionaceae bacterium]|nr:SGNH/GDSL hydrolase family protein [Desulfovibrionaceae bacterium]MBF0512814.1 SGNH/GDSL hydrolase family protein [Desulfovibrionaceae bacterium]
MKKHRKPLIASAVVLASVVLALTAADIIFRIYERIDCITDVDKNAPVFDLPSYDFNDHGPALARDEEPGEFRILSIGDSFTAAVTKPQYTFSAVLERDLNRLGTGKRVRVVNLGVLGVSFPEYMANYVFWSKLLRFDAVVFNICLENDFSDVEKTPYDPKLVQLDTFRSGVGVTLPHRYPLRFLDYIYGKIKASSHAKPANEYYRQTFQVPWDQYVSLMAGFGLIFNPEKLPKFVNGLTWAGHFMEFIKQLEDSGIKVAVMASPPHTYYNEQLLREMTARMGVEPEALDPALPFHIVKTLAGRHGVAGEIIDPDPCLALHAGKGEDLYYGTDTHWNVQGNQVIGDFLADALAARWFGGAPKPPASDCPAGAKSLEAGAPAKAALQGMIEKLGL